MGKKYIDYDELRNILKQRQIVRDTPGRRDEISEIIAVIDNLAEPNEHEELNEALDNLGRELLEGCRAYWQNRKKEKSNGVNWIPVTPETMPPYELETKLYSDAKLFLKIRRSRPLILRTEIDRSLVVYTGEYSEGEWYVKMNEDVVAIENGSTVTHWMYAKNLLEV